ncbi:bifunctional epoxide hydrolase 2 [Canis lupus familiaris]|uniref:Bifunctional epoxide hydrolase 2 n=4 Tax=Canis lupus TaxID=9612 RepID=A0A8C0PRQ1_CANLF|nr:bifunctional epoxide hydrolase 2 [Canis lupus familiaris]XP_025318801.1 bifunctional epoxide hydrolase 2 [Canis lupus dingo]XP_038291279.1 bifunctional epoxide hydrolase 2 [Canis lupus familiaris]
MALRAAVFDLDGVLALPSVVGALRRTEAELALPRGFLNEASQTGGPDGSSARLMRGEITFSQWVPLMEEGCRKCAEVSGICLPENFSISQIFGRAAAARKINHPMLQAALALRKKGYTTCILTNNWLDDSSQRGSLAQLVCQLSPHFNFVIESCRISMAKPDPQIYKFVLDTLKASPSEVVFLDDIGANLKPARDLGMATILVRDTDPALTELQKVTGVQLLQTAAALPVPCNPSDMSHVYVPIKPGVRLHCVELGSGPAVCLCHGFPESWFSWRYQIPALAQAGFRVLALDMKGYGESSSPPEIEEYSMEVLCQEMVTFLDKLGIPQAVFIGHDWGGMLVWNMALFYPERVRAVASLNTPFVPANPNVSTMEKIKANPVFDYQLYFQEPGVAEAELEQNLSRTFKSFFRASDGKPFLNVGRVRERGGLLVKTPEEPSLSSIVTEEDIQFYVQQFQKSGFRGPLNWYRNVETNWRWGCKGVGRKILIPALMVTAEKDKVLVPEMSKHMEDWIPYLKRGHIKDCGHWTQMEKPTELNQILIEWLETDARDPPVVSKL